MDINRANLESMFKMFNTAWKDGIGWDMPVDISFMFTHFNSTTTSNFYAWLENIPGFREWVGDRVFKNVRGNKFELTNRDFEDSVAMGRNEILDDQFGLYASLVTQMAAAWKLLKDYQIVIDVITGNDAVFTGSALLADDHAYGDNTIDNLVTTALSETTFNAAFLAAAGWKFANGEYCRTQFTHLLHGPKLRSTAFDLVDNKYVVADGTAGGTKDNPNYKRVERVEIPDFVGDYDDYWLLVDCRKPIKPFARQLRQEAKPLMDTDPATVMRTGRIDYMADGRVAACGTFPHLMYGGRL